MRPRAIKDLTQLNDPDFFAAVAEGLSLVVKNVSRLVAGAATLADAEQMHPSRVLTMVAEEEAAKVLILLDAVRCPRRPAERLAQQLGHFNDHLAKGLYAKSCGMRPSTLAELQKYIDLDREDCYLDGPNDVDWIFRNQVIDGRETALYVDYVAHDDADERRHRWSDPSEFEDLHFSAPEPWAITTARRLHEAGVCSAKALSIVADVWRTNPMEPETSFSTIRGLNLHMLRTLEEKNLLIERPAETYAWIVREWQFPLYALDLSKIKVDLDSLRERQRSWSPEGF